MSKLGQKAGMPKMRVMTDFCAELYWTIVSEMEVASVEEFERMMQGEGQNSEDMQEFEKVMKGYHDLVEYGRREIYKVEGWNAVRPGSSGIGTIRPPRHPQTQARRIPDPGSYQLYLLLRLKFCRQQQRHLHANAWC